MRSLKNLGPKGIAWVLIYLLIILPVSGVLVPSPSAKAATAKRSSAQDATGLVQQGIDAYQNKEFDKALQAFETAVVIYPKDYVIPYYSGLIYLEQGKRAKAIKQWKKYVKLAPKDETSLAVRKNITLLLRREAEAYAQKAVAEEAKLKNEAADENTVAITTFKNLGSDALNALGKAFAAMMIADISRYKDLKVVEREKLQALLKEMKLGTSGLVDEKSGPEVGRLLRAKYVSSGTLTDIDKENLMIASILFDATYKSPAGFQDIQGKLDQFYTLEKEIACQILKDLGRDCKMAPKAFNKIHTKSLAALLAYGQGLNYLDEEKFDEAREMFQKSLVEDPSFDLAEAALLATPFTAMLLLSDAQIASKAAADAPSPVETATASSGTAGGGLGIGTTAAIAGGGLLVIGGVAAALAGSGGSDGGGSSNDSEGFSGEWNGTWKNADETGGLSMNLTQTDSTVSGTMTLTGSSCLTGANVSGSLDGTHLGLNFSGGTLSAEYNASEHTLNGNLTINTGSCAGNTLEITCSKTGGVGVTW